MNKGSNKGSANINEREKAVEEQRQREEEKMLRKKAEKEEQERRKQENYERAEEGENKINKYFSLKEISKKKIEWIE
jgi:hypothetical protein